MAVLIEGISVVVRVNSIASKFRGGATAFKRIVPNRTLCADNELARVGFMTPLDSDSFVRVLTEAGLIHLKDGHAEDIVVVDQFQGFLSECTWAQISHVKLNEEGTKKVAACKLRDGNADRVVMPLGWVFEKSLSDSSTFVPFAQMNEAVKFVRREGNLDVYLDLATGKEVYVGRTSS